MIIKVIKTDVYWGADQTVTISRRGFDEKDTFKVEVLHLNYNNEEDRALIQDLTRKLVDLGRSSFAETKEY